MASVENHRGDPGRVLRLRSRPVSAGRIYTIVGGRGRNRGLGSSPRVSGYRIDCMELEDSAMVG